MAASYFFVLDSFVLSKRARARSGGEASAGCKA